MPGKLSCSNDAPLECVARGSECEAANAGADTCSGSKVNFCLDGFKAARDCAELGFAGCKDGACVVAAAP